MKFKSIVGAALLLPLLILVAAGCCSRPATAVLTVVNAGSADLRQLQLRSLDGGRLTTIEALPPDQPQTVPFRPVPDGSTTLSWFDGQQRQMADLGFLPPEPQHYILLISPAEQAAFLFSVAGEPLWRRRCRFERELVR